MFDFQQRWTKYDKRNDEEMLPVMDATMIRCVMQKTNKV
jgi:hypothetical protein